MILVFGSINLDIFIRSEQLPRPGETVLGTSHFMAPGGKGANQATAAARAGARTAMTGSVGRDAFAEPALTLMRETGVDLSGVRKCDEPTAIAMIGVEDSGENQILVSPGANFATVPPDDLFQHHREASILLTQNEVSTGASEKLATLRLTVPDAVRLHIHNAAPYRPLKACEWESIDILIVNEAECRSLAPPENLGDEPASVATALASLYTIDVVVTLGDRGALLIERDGQTTSLPSPDVKVIDTTGAGDAFTGAFAAALDEGQLPGQALKWGLCGGSLACTREGAQPSAPTRDEIVDLLEKQNWL